MYSLKDAWVKMQGSIPYKDWDGKISKRTEDVFIGFIHLHFSDQAAFSKFFSREQGISPKVYRRQK